MTYEAEQDPLCYPSSTVLRNKEGITDQADLDEFEFLMVLTRGAEPLPDGALDYAHYRAIHRHLFQDVYDWAGEPRTIRIAKGGNWFCYPENLERHMAQTFGALAAKGHLVGLGQADFAREAAYFLAELNAGHPFREGMVAPSSSFLSCLLPMRALASMTTFSIRSERSPP